MTPLFPEGIEPLPSPSASPSPVGGRPRSVVSRVPKVVLLIESSRASGRSLLFGIANYARHHGPWAFYWEAGGLEAARPRLRTLDADGVILRDSEAVEEVLALGMPAIVVGHRHREVAGLANVVTDSVATGTLAAEHLLERQFRHFAYCGSADTPWSKTRGAMFARRIAAAGFETRFFEPPPVRSRGPSKRELQTLARWLQTLPQPLGLMACNDDRGEQVIEACKMAGLRVPDQIAVIGADNDELVCELSDPRLSSVALNFERAGYESAALLAQLMQGCRDGPTTILVPATHVVTRHSTDILAIEDAGLAKALRYIQDHARESIRVDQVAEAAGLSRRVLEKRFRQSLNRSVLSQIRRIRIDQICRMLVETNQPVSQIALALGYTGVEHIARYFRAERQMSPLAYRRQHGRH